jgi:microcystin-dependent protein
MADPSNNSSNSSNTIIPIILVILAIFTIIIGYKVFIVKIDCPPQCPVGPTGPQGETGLRGPTGPQGDKGIQGIQGEKGDRGPIGPEGPRGPQGDKGIQGDSIKGPQGDVGPRGPTGPPGDSIRGPQGETGDTGKQGPKGEQGIQGPIGPAGPKGDQGIKGDTGATGPAPDLSPYAKTADLSPYAKTADLSPYAKTADLSPYAKTAELAKAVDLSPYAKTADLSPYAKTSDLTKYAPLANPVFTGTVGGITKEMIGLGNVNNTSDAAKPISTAQQSALDLKANLANPVFTGTVGGITKAMIGLGNVDNTTDLLKPISTAQQSALDLKANLANPTFTGIVRGITKAMVDLGMVDNTSDINKPVSTAMNTKFNDYALTTAMNTKLNDYALTTAMNTKFNDYTKTADMNTALGLKANLANPTFSGIVTIPTGSNISGYAKTADLPSLTPYALTTDMNTKFKDYTTTTAMNTKFNDYALTTAMNTKFNDYTTTTAMNTKFNDYAKSTEMNTKFDNYFDKNTIRNMLNATVPIGTIIAYSDDKVPLGFILCDGAAYDRVGIYSKLFDVIGITYGSSYVSKFNVPNIKSRTILGVDSNKALASTGGAENTTLTIANMPAHNHTVTLDTQGVHKHTGTTAANEGGHNHTIPTHSGDSNPQDKLGWSGTKSWKSFTIDGGAHTHNLAINDNGGHTHTATVGNRGDGTAFSVMQPYITLNYIIKFDDPSNVTAVKRVDVAINNENFDGEVANETVLNQFTTSTDPSFRNYSSDVFAAITPSSFKAYNRDNAGDAMTKTIYTILKIGDMDNNGRGTTAQTASNSSQFMMVKTFKNINDKLRQVSHPCYVEKNNNLINIRDEVNDGLWTPWVNPTINTIRYDVNDSVSGLTEIKPAPTSIVTVKAAGTTDYQHALNNAIATMNSNNTITAFSIANTNTGSPIIYYSGVPTDNSKVPSKTANATKVYTKTDVNGINLAQLREQNAIISQRNAQAAAATTRPAVRENYINRFSEYFGVF